MRKEIGIIPKNYETVDGHTPDIFDKYWSKNGTIIKKHFIFISLVYIGY